MLKCVITDDEPLAVKGLVTYIHQIDFLDLAATFESALELNTYLANNTVDLIFLDIQMPFMTGIDLLKSLKKPPMVIFTTAFDKYAVEGYELDIIDFLLKPVSLDRFLKASNKALQYKKLLSGDADESDYFFVKCGYRLEKIYTKSVIYIESMQNYLHIYTTDRKYTTHLTLKSIKQYLPDNQFIQTHQSYIVAMNKVQAIEGNQIVIRDFKVPISKYQKEHILESLVNEKLLKKK